MTLTQVTDRTQAVITAVLIAVCLTYQVGRHLGAWAKPHLHNLMTIILNSLADTFILPELISSNDLDQWYQDTHTPFADLLRLTADQIEGLSDLQPAYL